MGHGAHAAHACVESIGCSHGPWLCTAAHLGLLCLAQELRAWPPGTVTVPRASVQHITPGKLNSATPAAPAQAPSPDGIPSTPVLMQTCSSCDDGNLAVRRASSAAASTSGASPVQQHAQYHQQQHRHSNGTIARPTRRRELGEHEWVAPRSDDRAWTQIIASCRSPSELRRCLAVPRAMNKFHLTAALDKLASFHGQPRHDRLAADMLPLLLPRVREALQRGLHARSLSSVAHCLGAYEVKDKELMSEVARHAEACLSDFTPQGLANLLWGFARVGMQPSQRWMDAYLGTCQNQLSGFKPQELSVVLWSLARLKFKLQPVRLKELLQHVSQHLPQYCAHSLSNVLWALGMWADQRPDDAWLSATVAELSSPAKLQNFTDQGLSQSLWALVQLRYELSDAAKASITAALAARLPNCNTSIDLSTYLYACAGLQLPVSPELSVRLQTQTGRNMLSLQPRHLSCIVWSFARLGIAPGDRWLRRLFNSGFLLMGALNVRDVSMLAWGLAKLHILPPTTFLQPLVRRIEQLAADFPPQEVANTVWALAIFNVRPSSLLLAQFFEATDRRLSTFKPGELSQMIWALAERQCILERSWVQEFLKVSFVRLPDFSPQGLANVIWALARLGVSPPPAWLYSYVKAAQAMRESGRLLPVDLGTMINALNVLNTDRDLQKVSDFVIDAMDTLSAMEVDSQAYTRQQVEYMQGLRWSPQQVRSAMATNLPQAAAAAAPAEAEMGVQAVAVQAVSGASGGSSSARNGSISHELLRRPEMPASLDAAEGHFSSPLLGRPQLALAGGRNGNGSSPVPVSAAAVPELDVQAVRAYLEAQVQAEAALTSSQGHGHARDAAGQRRARDHGSSANGKAASVPSAQLGRTIRSVRQQRQKQQAAQPVVVGTLTLQVPCEMQIEMPDLHVELISTPGSSSMQLTQRNGSSGGGSSAAGNGMGVVAGAAGNGGSTGAAAVAVTAATAS